MKNSSNFQKLPLDKGVFEARNKTRCVITHVFAKNRFWGKYGRLRGISDIQSNADCPLRGGSYQRPPAGPVGEFQKGGGMHLLTRLNEHAKFIAECILRYLVKRN